MRPYASTRKYTKTKLVSYLGSCCFYRGFSEICGMKLLPSLGMPSYRFFGFWGNWLAAMETRWKQIPLNQIECPFLKTISKFSTKSVTIAIDSHLITKENNQEKYLYNFTKIDAYERTIRWDGCQG